MTIFAKALFWRAPMTASLLTTLLDSVPSAGGDPLRKNNQSPGSGESTESGESGEWGASEEQLGRAGKAALQVRGKGWFVSWCPNDKANQD